MEPSGGGRKERPKPREPAARLEKAKQKSAQQELKQRQRAEVSGLGGDGGGLGDDSNAGAESPCPLSPLSPLSPQIYALNRVMTELEQQQFDSFCKQMQASSE